jgi:hypothetical protein
MSRRSRNTTRSVFVLAGLASLWLLSTEPWGLGVQQLFMFIAPGALLGLGAAWAAHGSSQRQWTWKSARQGALVGGFALPPVLAFLIALDGNARPQRLVVGFVYAAWAVLIGGGIVALLRRPADQL